MATVKTTNRGEYGNCKARMKELLESLADLILEIGSDQAKRPRILPSGDADWNDTTTRQYNRLVRLKTIKKIESQDLVKEHAAKSKKRNRLATRQMEDPNNEYEVPEDLFDDEDGEDVYDVDVEGE